LEPHPDRENILRKLPHPSSIGVLSGATIAVRNLNFGLRGRRAARALTDARYSKAKAARMRGFSGALSTDSFSVP
jgi:hypothetical protein